MGRYKGAAVHASREFVGAGGSKGREKVMKERKRKDERKKDESNDL